MCRIRDGCLGFMPRVMVVDRNSMGLDAMWNDLEWRKSLVVVSRFMPRCWNTSMTCTRLVAAATCNGVRPFLSHLVLEVFCSINILTRVSPGCIRCTGCGDV